MLDIILTDQAKVLVEDINNSAVLSKTLGDLADEALIPQGIEIPKPESVFCMDGIPVFTKKSLSTLIGRAKSGKTTCTAWIIAQSIKDRQLVVWIDTEQGEYYGSRTQYWVLSIAGIPECQFLKYYDLKTHNPSIRTKIIELLITELHPDIVVVDGIRDLVFDINGAEEATITVGNLMKWADNHNCHILSILHQNKGNEHARGHLGSEMINKSESVIKVTKEDNSALTVCEPEFSRGEPFPSFAFIRDENGLPSMVSYQPKITGGGENQKKISPNDVERGAHYTYLIKAFGIDKKLSYGELIPAISASFESSGITLGVVKVKGFIAHYIQEGLLEKIDKQANKTFYSIKFDTEKSNGFMPISKEFNTF